MGRHTPRFQTTPPVHGLGPYLDRRYFGTMV